MATESVQARVTASLLRLTVRKVMSPRFSLPTQRRIINLLSLTVPAIGGVESSDTFLGSVPAKKVSTRSGGSEPRVAIIYLHGGGFAIGSPWGYRAMTTRIARGTALPVFVPAYRLAPEHPHPAQLKDVLACLPALETLGWPIERLIIAGDSAGANLALALTQTLQAKQRRVPRALALISPWSDLAANGNEHARDAIIDPRWVKQLRAAYAPAESWANAAVSPSYGRFESFPPTLIQSAAGEVLAPVVHDLVERMTQQKAPVQWQESPRLWHDFQLHAGTVPEAKEALRQFCEFISEQARSPT